MARVRLDDFKGAPLADALRHLESRIDVLERALMLDEEYRRTVPGLQDLYEQYQLLKQLAKDDSEA